MTRLKAFQRPSWRAAALALLLASVPAAAETVVLVTDGSGERAYDLWVRASQVQRALQRAGLPCDVVADAELSRQPVGGFKVAVLPSNPGLPASAAAWLKRFIGAGGRVIAFAPVPPALAQGLGVREAGELGLVNDRHIEEARFDRDRLFGLPEQWQQSLWTCQPLRPTAPERAVARWQGPDAAWHDQPAVTLTNDGAAVGAVFTGDDRRAEAQLLLALVTTWYPQVWHVAVPRVLNRVSRGGDVPALSEIRSVVARRLQPDRRALAQAALHDAVERLQAARSLYESTRRQGGAAGGSSPARRYLPVVEQAWQAAESARQAYYLCQSARRGEFRGVWLQDAAGIRQWDWQRTVRVLAENNLSALFVNVLNGGYANYPSQVMPHVDVAGEDPLREAVRWCREYGIECHVWIMCNFLRPLTPPDWRAQLEREGRLQANRAGETLGWLRPGDARNREVLAAAAAEIAARYDIDGIQLDYIRYAGADADYSAAERAAFEQHVGQPVADWPHAIDTPSPLRGRWLDWRRAQVDAEVETIAAAVRAVKPELRVSAAVWPIWAEASFAVGQDPRGWAAAGWMDFLCPMNYQTVDPMFLRYLDVQQRSVGSGVPLYPGLAAWRHETPADTIGQIRLLREREVPGFVLFHLDRRLATQWLPAMSRGVTAPEPRLGPPGPDTGEPVATAGR